MDRPIRETFPEENAPDIYFYQIMLDCSTSDLLNLMSGNTDGVQNLYTTCRDTLNEKYLKGDKSPDARRRVAK